MLTLLAEKINAISRNGRGGSILLTGTSRYLSEVRPASALPQRLRLSCCGRTRAYANRWRQATKHLGGSVRFCRAVGSLASAQERPPTLLDMAILQQNWEHHRKHS